MAITGFVTDAVFDVIARHGRIIICGQISQYHTNEQVIFLHSPMWRYLDTFHLTE